MLSGALIICLRMLSRSITNEADLAWWALGQLPAFIFPHVTFDILI